MNDQDLLALIERDRKAPLPEGPDPRWIATRINVEFGESQMQSESQAEVQLLVALGLLAAIVSIVWALYTRHAILLLTWPALLLLFTPLVLRQGVTRQ